MGHFLPFQPPDNLENKNFIIEKNTWIYNCTHLHHKWQSYNAWFLSYGAQQTEIFVIFNCCLPFYPPMDPENQNFEKMKKTPEDIIIIWLMCTINDSHMTYDSWSMEWYGQNFLLFWTIACLFTPIWTKKIIKQLLHIIIF